MNTRLPPAVARTPSPRHSVSKTSRSFVPGAGRNAFRKASVSFGIARSNFADPERTRQRGPLWVRMASYGDHLTLRTRIKARKMAGFGDVEVACGGVVSLIRNQ